MGLESALGWIGAIVEWLGRFVPRCELVDSTMGAIKWVNPLRRPFSNPDDYPQQIIMLGPGRWWYWPWTTKFERWPVVRTTRDLPVQTVTTTDGFTFGVRAVLTFEVEDLKLLIAYTEDPNDAVRDIAGTAVHDVLAELTREELLNKSLNRKLKGAAQTALKPFGVSVLSLTLLERAPSSMYRVVQNPISDML